jgi:MFS family permease
VLALFTLGNATDAFLLLRAQQLGVPVVLLPMLWAVHHVAKMASNVPGGALADRLGAKRVIAAGWVIYAATYAGFALAQTALHAWLLFVVYGLFYGLTEAPEKALVAALSRGARRGSAFGAYHFAIGMSALPASVIFGLVWQAYSPEAAFVMGATIAVVALALLLLTFRRIRVET